MTKEEAKEILSGYVKACKEDDFLTLEMFEYEKVIEAMAMGAKALSIPFLPSVLDEAADEYASKSWIHRDISQEQEQPELPGIEDPGIPGRDFIPIDWVDACERYGKWKIVRQKQSEMDLEKELHQWRHKHFKGKRDGDYSGEYLERESQLDLANHFYKLGLNARTEE